MFIKISRSEKGNNTGSVADLAKYLEKENKDKPIEKRSYFFTQTQDKVLVGDVIKAIDENKRKLHSKDGKFFMITLNPSQKELAHIGNDPEKLKAYTREVMDAYARNFNREITGEDLLYFAKIEYHRTIKGNEPEVKEGRVKQGDLKPGLQTHVHIIVSRKDRYNERQFSPLTHHVNTKKGFVKGGFDRARFFHESEKIFDKVFSYQREANETFQYQNLMKNGNVKDKYLLEITVKEAQKRKIKGPKLAKLLQGIGRNSQSGQTIDPDLLKEETKKKKGLEL